jgi:hypothetical protein
VTEIERKIHDYQENLETLTNSHALVGQGNLLSFLHFLALDFEPQHSNLSSMMNTFIGTRNFNGNFEMRLAVGWRPSSHEIGHYRLLMNQLLTAIQPSIISRRIQAKLNAVVSVLATLKTISIFKVLITVTRNTDEGASRCDTFHEQFQGTNVGATDQSLEAFEE